jgi:hypothetical protein
MKILTNLDLAKNQLLNARVQNLATAPTSPVKGQLYFNTASGRLFVYNGSEWIGCDALGASMTGADIVAAINGSTAIIDLDNLPESVGSAVDDSHTHSNKAILDDTSASFTTTLKSKLDGIESGANNYTHPSGDGNLHVPATGTTNNGKVLTAGSSAGSASWQTPAVAWSNVSGKPSSTPSNIDDAVSKRHEQNTDTGTTSNTFTIGQSGVKVKNGGGELQVRNNTDTDYADLRVKNLTVEGTTTTINSNEVNIGDNILLLNSDVEAMAQNDDGGIIVKRLDSDGARKDAELIFDNSLGKWVTTGGAVTGDLVTAPLANKVTAKLGDGTKTSFVVTHNLKTRDLVVTIRENASPYAQVITDVEFTTEDTITVKFAVAPTNEQYSITIVG